MAKNCSAKAAIRSSFFSISEISIQFVLLTRVSLRFAMLNVEHLGRGVKPDNVRNLPNVPSDKALLLRHFNRQS